MKNMTSLIALFFTTFLFFSCSEPWEKIQEGNYKEETYSLEYQEHKGFSTNSFKYRIQLGKLPSIPVNATTMDWGPVYSDDIFGADAYSFIPNLEKPYLNNPYDDQMRYLWNYTMLYLSPQRFSEEVYEKYLHFFLEEWPNVDQELRSNSSTFPEIMGLVYGESSSYKRVYEGMYQGQEYLLVIENDGRISMQAKELSMFTGSNIKPTIQMPGKKIIIIKADVPGELNLESIRNFKDKNGNDPTQFFNVLEVEKMEENK